MADDARRPEAGDSDYRTRSFWLDTMPGSIAPRPALGGDLDVDVAIVGAGYTGLWTAYYLQRNDPSIRIAVLEAEIAGYGASGRNGGWCSARLPMSVDKLAAVAGHDRAMAMERAMFDTVDEVGRVAAAEGIDCQFHKAGYLHLATSPAHVERVRRSVATAHRHGFTEDDERWLDAAEARARIGVAEVHGAGYSAHCAVINPARLVRGLADVVEHRGATIFEQTRVRTIEPRRVTTDHGVVKADHVVRATEGFTPALDGMARHMVPIYSLMIATEPLPTSFWDEVGWAGREPFKDARNLFIYAQRTVDGRIAFGGRGAPYHFGSAVKPEYDRSASTFEMLHRELRTLFPQLGDARITHRWGGPLGTPRDWFSSVGLDRATGLGWSGGYVGQGVATANLGGRTLADLICDRGTDITRLPWVDHVSPRWEPEPLRWIGINAMVQVPKWADRSEVRTGKPARRRIALLGKVLGQ